MKRTAFRSLVLAAVLAAVPAPGASAADFSQADLTPYVLVQFQRAYATTQPRPESYHDDGSTFITQGGALFSNVSARTDFGVPRSQIYRGLATPGQLQELRDRLNAAKIRGLTSCELLGERSVGTFDFVWYSAKGRRNAFTVVTGDGTSGLPRCPAAVDEVFSALSSFENQVLQNPDREILSLP
jgi:hypothetical protein